MRVFVNAVSVREGGSQAVLVKLTGAMRACLPDVALMAAAPPHICEQLSRDAVAIHPVAVGRSPLGVLRWYERDLAKAARRWRADVVFSVTNYLPRRPLPCPTLLLEQNAGHFSPLFDRLTREANGSRLARFAWERKRRWVRRSVEAATVLTVQTAVLADAVAAATRVPRDAIRVIPHGPGWVEHADQPRPSNGGTPFRIGYVSKWGVQKNFETLFRAVRMLKQECRAVRLVVTLDPAYRPAADLLAWAGRAGVENVIENHGEISTSEIAAIYDSLDVFAFPSSCESFGLPMVEAMARGLAIVIADTPENREVCGGAALAFPPQDAGQLAALLRALMDDKVVRQAAAARSLRRGRAFSWAKAAEETLAALDAAVSA